MIIKKSSKNKTIINWFYNFFKRYRFSKILVFFLIFFTFAISFTSYGIFLHRNKKVQNIVHLLADVYENRLGFISNYITSLNSNSSPIQIDIKFKHLDRINNFINLSSERGYIFEDVKSEEFPGKLTYDGKTFKVKISLTGQYLDHIKSNKNSFNIEVKDGLTIMGMSKFKLLIPSTRGYLADWIGHELQKREGLIVPRFDFKEVIVNGENKGVFGVEEMYNVDLIENNNLRDGIIFKPNFNDIEILNQKKIISDSLLIRRVKGLKKLWQSFVNKEIPVESLFDVEKFAIDYATTDIISGIHSKFLLNLRYYYNPITNLIEPISREFGFLRNSYEITGQDKTHVFLKALNEDSDLTVPDKTFHKLLFRSEKLKKIYLEKLNQYSKTSYLDLFFDSINDKMYEKEKLIYKDNPFYSYPKRFLYENQKIIQQFLSPTNVTVFAEILKEKDAISLNVSNNLNLPIEVISIKLNKKQNSIKNGIVFSNKVSKIILNQVDDNFDFNEIMVEFKILGGTKIYQKFVTKFNQKFVSFNPSTMSESFFEAGFLKFDSKKNFHKIISGNYIIDKTYIIDEGLNIVFEEGVNIDFINGGGLISYSAIDLNGTDRNPIIIGSSDSLNTGLTFLNTTKTSNFKNVIISNLSNHNSDNYNLTGGLTFYQSDVIFNQCTISDNLSGDDLLNIFRSKFKIIQSNFVNSLSDALYADFCEGIIIDSNFLNSGNDAIDISGTNLEISNLYINKAQDKALSAGENSIIKGSDINILNSEIGICSKDLSTINISNFVLKNNKIGITAFQKKSKFGPGYLNLSKGIVKENEVDYLIEKNSIAYLNNNFLVPNDGNLKDQFYGVKYGKSSK